ncbi:MAG: hypothetical protein GPJ52_11520 [Candidatus Heimdallarchaeota archaeon]|nr:hypothetical protein [Candidatus Heimdallarchaeota archaeon]
MTEEKNKGGRPRKHATNADRQRAYYERKKQRMKELEEKLAKLETRPKTKADQKKITRKIKDLSKASFPWKKITPGEIALIGEKELKRLIDSFSEKIAQNSSLVESILNLIITSFDIDSSGSLDDLTDNELEQLSSEIDSIIHLSQESNQQQTFLYLLEAELASRERSVEREFKLDVLESETEEFLKEKKKAEKKDEIKITRS